MAKHAQEKNMAPVIEAKDLYKCYPGFPPVLRGVNISVEPGEMVAIMGPSGCGKSTMLHVLGMLHAPDSGSLKILDQDVLALNNEGTAAFRRGNMGFVMQASNLFEHSTVFENVEFPLIYENVPPQERWERVIRALDLVRLSGRVHYRSNRLSGGEQQRVAIARAMVNNPRILLADEPTGALDARTSRVIMENFRNLCHKGGVAMVMVTHDPKMAEYCDSIYTLEDGVLRCQKHDPPKLELDASHSFLSPPPPLVAGSLVAGQFPDSAEPTILELARRMHELHLLSRIYALTKSGIFAGQGNYSLPLAVRRMGFWQRLGGLWAFIGGASPTAKKIYHSLPKAANLGRTCRRLASLGRGILLAHWTKNDKIEFLYATGAREVGSAAWVAAKLSQIPFAFAVRGEDIPKLGPDVRQRAEDAAFITCSTEALKNNFREICPNIKPEKILLLPNLPMFTNMDDEPEPAMPRTPGQATRILITNPASKTFKYLLVALRQMIKQGFPVELQICGSNGLSLRWAVWQAGLRKATVFAGASVDRMAEIFRETDIYVAVPSAKKGQELVMPWEITEAMALALPIVTTGITPGMGSAMIRDKNCLVGGDAFTLRECLVKVIKTPELGTTLGQNARESLRKYLDTAQLSEALCQRVKEAVAKK